MRHTLLVLALTLAVAACSKKENPAQPTPTTGAGTAVSISGNAYTANAFYTPTTLNTTVGATITWTNMDSVAHTTVSNTGVWNSNNISTNGTFSFQFTAAGTYQYHCTIHPAMTGTVVVQ
jgi:plastocyanin